MQDRKHKRIKLFRVADVSFIGQQLRTYQTRNISLTGMFIVGQTEFSQGTPCAITLTEHWTGRPFVMNFTGKVARHDQEGIALQFTEMTLETYALLQTVLLYGSNNPDLLGQEFASGYPFEISEYRHRTASAF